VSRRTFLGLISPPTFGGRTSGTPKHVSFGHSSASIAHPFKSLFPISEDAESDCSRRLLDTSDSGGGSKSCRIEVSETSVGGVDGLESCASDDISDADGAGALETWLADASLRDRMV